MADTRPNPARPAPLISSSTASFDDISKKSVRRTFFVRPHASLCMSASSFVEGAAVRSVGKPGFGVFATIRVHETQVRLHSPVRSGRSKRRGVARGSPRTPDMERNLV